MPIIFTGRFDARLVRRCEAAVISWPFRSIHPGYESWRGHSAHRSHRQDLSKNRRPARPIALVLYLLVRDALEFARSLLDRPFDVVVGHTLGLGSRNGGSKPPIGIDVSSTHPRRNANFLDEFGEELSPFGVFRGFLVFDRTPL